MLVLGHAGITLGAGVLLNSALIKSGRAPFKGQSPQSSRKLSWISSLGSRIDIRILMMGSLLPDIIDKPVGRLLLRDTLNNGRIFSHTLLFFTYHHVDRYLPLSNEAEKLAARSIGGHTGSPYF